MYLRSAVHCMFLSESQKIQRPELLNMHMAMSIYTYEDDQKDVYAHNYASRFALKREIKKLSVIMKFCTLYHFRRGIWLFAHNPGDSII